MVLILELYTDKEGRKVVNGVDSFNLAAACQRASERWKVEDEIITRICAPNPNHISEKRVASDPEVPGSIRRLISTAVKLRQLQLLTRRKKWHRFVQCVFQALAHVQLGEVLRLAGSRMKALRSEFGVWTRRIGVMIRKCRFRRT